MVALASVVLGGSPAGASTSLTVPQSIAFSILHHSCGGIQEQILANGFDAVSGYPTGDVYLQTRCGGSGRGGGYRTTTYSSWLAVTWDYTGAVVAYAESSGPATIDPAFSAVDASGNEVRNQLNATNVAPAACSVGNTTYCTYRAFLTLATDFAPPPRITNLSVASGPASGGTIVTIAGTGFSGATAVEFGATPAASFTVNSDVSITATTPVASSGAVEVVVTTAGGPSAAEAGALFTFVAAPTVTSVSPDTGPLSGGTLVTITGVDFVEVSEVDFGETPVGFSVDDPTSITAVSPPGEAPETVRVRVVTLGGASPTTPAGAFTYVDSGPVPSCGDGTVDPGEDCDDGATTGEPGGCCTATCQFAGAGSACAEDGDLCTADVCDGVGTCVHAPAPAPACTPPDLAKGASLLLHTMRTGLQEVQFTWGKGPEVSYAELGDPSAGDDVRLCIYEQSAASAPVLAYSGAPSKLAGTWKRRSSGWQFHSKTGVPDGVTQVALRPATVPLKASLRVTAMRAPTATPLPVASGATITAQIKSSLGTCWGATFANPTTNTAVQLKAKSD